jgi:hypothetical protein
MVICLLYKYFLEKLQEKGFHNARIFLAPGGVPLQTVDETFFEDNAP